MTGQGQSFAQLLDLFYVLLAVSVIISVFGMINTLALAVFERTRELGMLRALGMSRRQVRRMLSRPEANLARLNERPATDGTRVRLAASRRDVVR